MNTNSIINEKDNKSEESNNSATSKSSSKSSLNEKSEEKIKMKKRATKKEKYAQERKEIIQELNEIVGINQNNQIFLYELERNEKVNEYLKKNIEKIRKYHKTGSWGYFSNEQTKGKGNDLGLLRSIYLDNDYSILSKLKINNFDNKRKQYTLLIFLKNITNN
jgi:hypothetical protein